MNDFEATCRDFKDEKVMNAIMRNQNLKEECILKNWLI